MKTIGYARVSTRDQSLAMQRQALVDAGCDVIHTDEASGAVVGRKGLQTALRGVQDGNMLVVWKLDRLGRLMRHVVTTVLDLGTSTGKLLLSVFGWLAGVERDLTIERTRAAFAAAKRRGVELNASDVDHARRTNRQ